MFEWIRILWRKWQSRRQWKKIWKHNTAAFEHRSQRGWEILHKTYVPAWIEFDERGGKEFGGPVKITDQETAVIMEKYDPHSEKMMTNKDQCALCGESAFLLERHGRYPCPGPAGWKLDPLTFWKIRQEAEEGSEGASIVFV